MPLLLREAPFLFSACGGNGGMGGIRKNAKVPKVEEVLP